MKTRKNQAQDGESKLKSSGLTALAKYMHISENASAGHWYIDGLPPVSDAPLADTRVRDYITKRINGRSSFWLGFKSTSQLALRVVPSLYLRPVTKAILTLYAFGHLEQNAVQYLLLVHSLLQDENTPIPDFCTYKNTFSKILNGLPQKFVPRVEIEPISSTWKTWQQKCFDFAKKFEKEHFHILEEREKEYTDLQIFCNTQIIPTIQQLSALLKQKAPKSYTLYNPIDVFDEVFLWNLPDVFMSNDSQLIGTLEALIGFSGHEIIRKFSDEAAIFIKAAYPQIEAEEKLIRAMLLEMRDIYIYSSIPLALLFLDAAAKGVDFADIERELERDDSMLDPDTTELFSSIWDTITRLPKPKEHSKRDITTSLFWFLDRIVFGFIKILDRL